MHEIEVLEYICRKFTESSNLKLVTFISIISIGLLSLLSISCTKESFVDYVTDTTTISKVYQTNEDSSIDAVVESLNPNTNYGNSTHLTAFSWTNGGSFNTSRSFLKFDLSDITPQTKISSATLSLFYSNYGNLSEQSGNNAFTIFKVSVPWDENTITWANQPTFTNIDSISIVKSSSPQQSYTDIDVTPVIQDMINNPSNNHGFMIKLNKEFPYRLLILASSNHSEASKRPKLVVEF